MADLRAPRNPAIAAASGPGADLCEGWDGGLISCSGSVSEAEVVKAPGQNLRKRVRVPSDTLAQWRWLPARFQTLPLARLLAVLLPRPWSGTEPALREAVPDRRVIRIPPVALVEVVVER